MITVTQNLAFIRRTIRGHQIVFEQRTGQYSFASDSSKPADMATDNYVCNACHTQTNHHQNDGTAPGNQSHYDGQNCSTCHAHTAGFKHNTTVPAPHNTTACTACHTPTDYIPNAAIANTKCQACHDAGAPGTAGGGSDRKVITHYSDNFIDPTTDKLQT